MANYNQSERPPWWDVRNDVTQIKISDGFTTIGNCAFEEFSKVVKVDIPASVETIAISAFCGCTSLKTVVGGEGIKMINQNAFQGCANLENFQLPSRLSALKGYAFHSCSSLTSIVIPQTLSAVGPYAFFNCTGLSSVEFHAGLREVNNDAFRQCTGLREIQLPSSVTAIYSYAFGDCSNLNKIVLLSDKLQLFSNAFSSCTSLKHIYFGGTKGDSALLRPFNNCPSISDVLVSPNYLGEKFYGVGVTGFFGVCGEAMEWTLLKSTKTLAITGDGKMYDYDKSSPAPWTPKVSLVNTVDITLVTSVGRNAFNGLVNLKNIRVDTNHFKLSDNVLYTSDEKTLIKYPATNSLAWYKILPSVSKILDGAFSDCNADFPVLYQSVAIPDCTNEWANANAIPNVFVPLEYLGNEFCGTLPSLYGTADKGAEWAFNRRTGGLTIEGS